MPSSYQFSDFDVDFSKNDFVNDFSLKHDRNSIRQSIMNIILTRKGEKPFKRNFGVGIYDLLFEVLDPIDLANLEVDIINQVNAREPRSEVTSVFFDDSGLDQNSLTMTVNFTVFAGTEANPINDSIRIEVEKVR